MSADPKSEPRHPDLFLVGAPRSGTTSLYTYLKQHPDIYLSVLKEPCFFSTDLTPPPQAIRDQETYLGLFADARQETRLGEGSVWYLMSQKAPWGIRQLSPDARILVMLRNPIDLIHSLHGLYLRTGNEELTDLSAALEAQADRRHGRRLPASVYFPEGLQYTQVARCANGVARFFEAFPRHQIHVEWFEDFVADTTASYRRVLEFLEVDPSFEPEYDLERAAQKLRFQAIRQMRRVPAEIRERMRGAEDTHRSVRRAPLEPVLRSRLREQLGDDIERLGKMLGRDLTHWN